MRYLYCLAIVLAILIPTMSYTQTQKIGLNMTGGIGIVPPILSDGSGIVLALHPHYKQWNSTSIDGLISYSNINRTDVDLLGGIFGGKDRKYTLRTLNFMLGIRRYLNPPENKNRFFINLLGGVSREIQVSSDKNEQLFINSAYSLGMYYEFKPILIGVGLESPDIFFIRFGFVVL